MQHTRVLRCCFASAGVIQRFQLRKSSQFYPEWRAKFAVACSARRSGGPQPSFGGQAFQLSKIGLARILVGFIFTRAAVRACLAHQIV
jgi:hypothetical protein